MHFAKSAIACIVVACGHAPPKKAVKGEAERLLDGFVIAISASDRAAMERLYTDEVVVVGLPGCKGKPCVGKQDLRERYLEKMLEPHPLSARVIHAEGDRVWADWITELPVDEQRTETLRGSLIITAAGGRISRLAFFYDLADPVTILRRSQREVVFALHEMPGLVTSPARVLLTQLDHNGHPGKTHTGVAIYLNSRAADATRWPSKLSAATHRGTCVQLGAVAHSLEAFVDARSDSLLPVTLDALRSDPFSVVLRGGEEILACGDVPAAVVD